jgi:glycosyltransferase involved in cell wall biosynthesis
LSVVQLCGVAVLTAAMALTVKATGSKLAPLVPLFGGTVLLMAAIARYREPINAMLTLAEDRDLRLAMGKAGRSFVEQRFDQEKLMAAILADRKRLLGE